MSSAPPQIFSKDDSHQRCSDDSKENTPYLLPADPHTHSFSSPHSPNHADLCCDMAALSLSPHNTPTTHPQTPKNTTIQPQLATIQSPQPQRVSLANTSSPTLNSTSTTTKNNIHHFEMLLFESNLKKLDAMRIHGLAAGLTTNIPSNSINTPNSNGEVIKLRNTFDLLQSQDCTTCPNPQSVSDNTGNISTIRNLKSVKNLDINNEANSHNNLISPYSPKNGNSLGLFKAALKYPELIPVVTTTSSIPSQHYRNKNQIQPSLCSDESSDNNTPSVSDLSSNIENYPEPSGNSTESVEHTPQSSEPLSHTTMPIHQVAMDSYGEIHLHPISTNIAIGQSNSNLNITKSIPYITPNENINDLVLQRASKDFPICAKSPICTSKTPSTIIQTHPEIISSTTLSLPNLSSDECEDNISYNSKTSSVSTKIPQNQSICPLKLTYDRGGVMYCEESPENLENQPSTSTLKNSKLLKKKQKFILDKPKRLWDFNNYLNNHFSAQEVALHNTADDCWLIVAGEVYDVTMMISEHPGGTQSILRFAGQVVDCHYDFHSPRGKEIWKQYRIGVVEKSTIKPVEKSSICSRYPNSPQYVSTVQDNACNIM